MKNKDKFEWVEDGWKKEVHRLHCTKGFIDRFRGDGACDPNFENPPLQHINTAHTWVRLNGEGKWHSIRDFGRMSELSLITEFTDLCDTFTAKEIWEEYFIEENL